MFRWKRLHNVGSLTSCVRETAWSARCDLTKKFHQKFSPKILPKIFYLYFETEGSARCDLAKKNSLKSPQRIFLFWDRMANQVILNFVFKLQGFLTPQATKAVKFFLWFVNLFFPSQFYKSIMAPVENAAKEWICVEINTKNALKWLIVSKNKITI